MQLFYFMFFFSTDILTRNLVSAAIDWDRRDNHDKRPCDRDDKHVQALVSVFNSCGVCFKIWEKKDADGSGSGTYDFTSLMGSDKKLLLKNLPEKLEGVIPADRSSSVIKLWKVIIWYKVTVCIHPLVACLAYLEFDQVRPLCLSQRKK